MSLKTEQLLWNVENIQEVFKQQILSVMFCSLKLRVYGQSFSATFGTPCSLCCQISVGL